MSKYWVLGVSNELCDSDAMFSSTTPIEFIVLLKIISQQASDQTYLYLEIIICKL